MSILSDRQIKRELGDAGRIKPFAGSQTAAGVISHGLSSYGYDLRIGYTAKVFTPARCGVVDPKEFDPNSFVDIDVTPDPHDWAGDGICRRCNCTAFPGQDQAANPDVCCFQEVADHFLIPPNSFALAETVEWVDVPRDLLGIICCKSTYARCGLILPTTVIEPGWRGTITLELANSTPLPLKVYAGEGIAQLLFFRSDERVEELIAAIHSRSGIIDAVEELITSASCGVSYADRKGRYQGQSGVTLPKVGG